MTGKGVRNLILAALIVGAGVAVFLALSQDRYYGTASMDDVRTAALDVLDGAERGVPKAYLNMAGRIYEPGGAFCEDAANQKAGHAGDDTGLPMLRVRRVVPGAEGPPGQHPVYLWFAEEDGAEVWWLDEGKVDLRDGGVLYAEGALVGRWFAKDEMEGEGEPLPGDPVPFAAFFVCQ